MIPRLIHQISLGLSKEELPYEVKDNVKFLKENNPNWCHTIYEDEHAVSFIREHYPQKIRSFYLSLNEEYGAARADFLRYLLLYKFGGVYLDLKSTITKKLDDVLLDSDAYILAHWENKIGDFYQGWGIFPELPAPGEYQQWHIIAAPGHPFLAAAIIEVANRIQTYDPQRSGVGFRAVLRTTGPIAYTTAIARCIRSHPFRMIRVNDFGLVYSIVSNEGRAAHHRLSMRPTYHYLKSPLVIRQKA
jgi:inositol phosphorylceramide mannosyltransferase catalytic subunit